MRPVSLLDWRGRRLSARWRALPDFILIGAPRAGTTTLYRELARHPQVEPAAHQEIHFFNRTPTYGRGLAYYRAFFPLERPLRSRGATTGEGTSVYMFRPHTAERIARDLPEIQLIAVLRDPVERALASWQAFHDRGEEHRPLLDAVTAEIESLGPGDVTPPPPPEVSGDNPQPAHVHKGRYAEQLRRWLDLFGVERLLVVFSEELFSSPQSELERVHRFLGLEPHDVSELQPAPLLHSPEAEEARETLRAYYEAPDAALANLLGRALPWG